MKKRLVASLVLLSLFACAACCAAPLASTPLIGKWRSDRTLTMNYFRKTVKSNAVTTQFLEDTTGHLTLEFTRDRVRADTPAFDFHVLKRAVHEAASHIESPYSVVATNGKTVSISIMEKGKATTKTYNFEGNDTIWIATDGAPPREYYSRIH
jgi:hypothetical protein